MTLGSNAKFHERRARLSPANIMPPHNSSHIPIVSNAVTSASNAKLQERKARLSAANIMPGSSSHPVVSNASNVKPSQIKAILSQSNVVPSQNSSNPAVVPNAIRSASDINNVPSQK